MNKKIKYGLIGALIAFILNLPGIFCKSVGEFACVFERIGMIPGFWIADYILSSIGSIDEVGRLNLLQLNTLSLLINMVLLFLIGYFIGSLRNKD